MRLLFASDIHGSYYYAKRLVELYARSNAERLILLGDILYHGPRNDLPRDYAPKKVIPLLNELKNEILCVRGNCDTEVDQMVLEFPILADYAVLFLDGKRVYLTHGHKFTPDSPPPICAGDVMISGHTHIPMCEERGGILFVNPGSVAIPKGGSTPSCIIYEDGEYNFTEID